MKSKVYFCNLRAKSVNENKISKIQKLFDAAGFSSAISENDFTAIKLHFGERGSDGFISPVLVRKVVDKISECKANPFLTDTNTLYLGERHNSIDHLKLAIEHGFDFSVVGAPLIIADGLKSTNIVEVPIHCKHFDKVKIAGDINHADSMIVLSHFKGHPLAGFGGAVKNLAMGCAPAAGKREQHSPRPEVSSETCVGCRQCVPICPVKAISIIDGKAVIDMSKCIGCCDCVSRCSVKAIAINWETEVIPFMEKMTEYALGAIKGKEGKIGYINFLTNITPDCDCFPWSDAPIVPDIGFLASTDPIALDKASFDLVNKQHGYTDSKLCCNHEAGKDKFKGIRDYTEGFIQIGYGEAIGIGSAEYELIEV